MKNLFSLFLILIFPINSFGQQYPFQNPDLSSEERARDLISRLTLEEKATLMCDQSDVYNITEKYKDPIFVQRLNNIVDELYKCQQALGKRLFY